MSVRDERPRRQQRQRPDARRGTPERERRRPCGCLADPAVFGHACAGPPLLPLGSCSCGVDGCTLGFPSW